MYFTAGRRDRAERTRLLKQQASPAIMRKMRHSPDLMDLAARTRTMTFVVCRVRSFEGIVDNFAADPAGLSQLLRRMFTPLIQAIHDNSGTINRQKPGRISAFFNAPLDDPDHACHACECALAMQASLEEINRLEQDRESDTPPLPPITLSIGINTGTGIVGDFGTSGRPDYTALGRASEWSHTLQRLCPIYNTTILVGAATRALAEKKFPFLEVDVLAGDQNRPAPLFALLGNSVARANPKFFALKSYHEQIFQAYRTQRWGQARNLIAQCRSLSGANPALYDLYLSRIERYESHPPPANWNGVFTPAPS